jgi:hypothetical protein
MAIRPAVAFSLLILAGPQPAQAQEWVAFDADYVSSTLVGRFYRAEDGSMRQEEMSSDGSKRIIAILNIARASTTSTRRTTILGKWPR